MRKRLSQAIIYSEFHKVKTFSESSCEVFYLMAFSYLLLRKFDPILFILLLETKTLLSFYKSKANIIYSCTISTCDNFSLFFYMCDKRNRISSIRDCLSISSQY